MDATIGKEASPEAALAASPARSYWAGVAHRFMRDRMGLSCMMIIGLIVGAAVLAPLLVEDPLTGRMLERLKPIGTPGHILGTDELGRDMLSRLIYGARLSLTMALLPVALAFVAGAVLGVLAGYFGGRFNMAVMRVMDVFYAFPSVLLAVAISGALGAGIFNALLSLTIVFVPPIARVAESVTTQVRNLDFVRAAVATGASSFAIIRVHILSNVIGPVFVYATSLVSISLILASGLSFLGLGARPPQPEWGLMLNTLRTAIYTQPWIAALPGVFIFVTSICFNLMADALRSAMDVKR